MFAMCFWPFSRRSLDWIFIICHFSRNTCDAIRAAVNYWHWPIIAVIDQSAATQLAKKGVFVIVICTFSGTVLSSPHTSPCKSCVCSWCCLPCCSCWEFLKIIRVHVKPIASLGHKSLTGANGCLIILDFTKATRLWGTPTANLRNVAKCFTVSTTRLCAIWHYIHKKNNDSFNCWQHEQLFWFSLSLKP